MPGGGVQEEVRILDALGDAFVGEQLAEIITRDEGREVLGRNVGLDRHVF
jgi:hypothetical protein